MPKEVLLKYSRQRKFVWARNILMALVILTILALIALVIAIIVISPPCLEYWQTSPIYQVYPKSFKDSWNPDPNAAEGETDGIGDIYGETGKYTTIHSITYPIAKENLTGIVQFTMG